MASKILKRACRDCGVKEAVVEDRIEEPNEVDYEVDPVTGFERMIVHSTMISRYTRCTYCGSRDC